MCLVTCWCVITLEMERILKKIGQILKESFNKQQTMIFFPCVLRIQTQAGLSNNNQACHIIKSV